MAPGLLLVDRQLAVQGSPLRPLLAALCKGANALCWESGPAPLRGPLSGAWGWMELGGAWTFPGSGSTWAHVQQEAEATVLLRSACRCCVSGAAVASSWSWGLQLGVLQNPLRCQKGSPSCLGRSVLSPLSSGVFCTGDLILVGAASPTGRRVLSAVPQKPLPVPPEPPSPRKHPPSPPLTAAWCSCGAGPQMGPGASAVPVPGVGGRKCPLCALWALGWVGGQC